MHVAQEQRRRGRVAGSQKIDDLLVLADGRSPPIP